jgi:16S rRNA (cytosine1402-N4)-methyltransferase
VNAAPWQHTTVLLEEAIDALVTTPSGVYVDGTFGRGGHARRLLERLAPDGRLIALDRDPAAVAAANAGATRVDDPRFSIHHANFAQLPDVPRARLQLSFRRPAGHAHGSDPWRERRGFPGPRR